MRGYRGGHLTPLRISAADSRIASDGERLPRGLYPTPSPLSSSSSSSSSYLHLVR